MKSRLAKVSLFGNAAKAATVNLDATNGAQIGSNLLLPDGSLGTVESLRKLFGSTAAPASLNTTDDLEEGQWHLWFTDRRAQDAVGSILANSANITLAYVAGTSLTADLTDLADSGAGSLLAATFDAKGRKTGSRDATITGTAGRITVANGSAAAGAPTIDLDTVADAGGGALLRFVRDTWGRITGTSAATTDDLTEGSRLYYTNARADARITAQKGLANGLAPLEGDGKISTGYLPAAVLGQVSYQGTWDASAGTAPTSTPSKGWYYIVTVAGSTSLSGITDWQVGDWAIYNGASWNKIDNTDAIASWNGRTGAVLPASGDYTAAQVGAEPTIAAGTTAQYRRGDKSWRDFATDVRAAVLTGLSTATSAVIAATDTVLGALGKLQAQITSNAAIQAGYIDGLKMVWNSGTSISVTSGAAYIQGSSAIISSPSTLTLSSLSLTASTWYHLYLYLNAGTPAIECVTTSPAAAYSGTARSKTGATSRRYIGSVLTDASGNICNFLHATSSGTVLYQTSIFFAPFQVVAGSAASATTVSCASVVPSTGIAGQMAYTNNDPSIAVLLGNSIAPPAASPSIAFLGQVGHTLTSEGLIPLDSSQAFQYMFLSTPTANFVARVKGYSYER